MRSVLVILVVVMCLPLSVKAEEYTGALISGKYLLDICARDDDGKEIVVGGHTACQAYIAGLVDYHNLLRSLGTAPSVDLCVPNTVKLNDLQDIVWGYLHENSHHDAFIAAPAVSLALFQFFPCRKPE